MRWSLPRPHPQGLTSNLTEGRRQGGTGLHNGPCPMAVQALSCRVPAFTRRPRMAWRGWAALWVAGPLGFVQDMRRVNAVLSRSRGRNLPCVYSTKWPCSQAAQYILGVFGITHVYISFWKKLAFTLLSFQCQVRIENEHYISLFLGSWEKLQPGCQGKRQMMSVKKWYQVLHIWFGIQCLHPSSEHTHTQKQTHTRMHI